MPDRFEYPKTSKVHCPKCGSQNRVVFSATTGYSIEYVGVCGTETTDGGTCGTTLILQATAHFFPVEFKDAETI